MDYYDKAVAYLTENPSKIHQSWDAHASMPAGRLFSPVSVNRRFWDEASDPRKECGCLTQIRAYPSDYCASTSDLTAAIMADDRIPINAANLTVDDLHVFAEWQRRIDAELGREPPVWVEPGESP